MEAVLHDSANKLKMFMGHQVRCHVQHSVFSESDVELQEGAPRMFGIIPMDCIMKYEPKQYQKKLSDWYGRKGMTWHGRVITCRAVNTDGTETTGSNNDKGEQRYMMKNFYLDHIGKNGTNQTAFAVASIMELVCRVISRDLPSM